MQQLTPAVPNSNTLLTSIIMHMKKLLDSDWLRAVQFKCSTSAKSVTKSSYLKWHIIYQYMQHAYESGK